jgi:hypothetical protein
MRFTRFGLLFALLFLHDSLWAQASGQQASLPAPHRDPQAVLILTQALSVAGGIEALSAIQDFTGTGTITYYWAGQEVSGAVTVRGRGTGQFRLDASLPSGERSWAVNNGTGVLKEANGTVNSIQGYNAVNLGSLTFPFACLVAALKDSSLSISYIGLETRSGAQVNHVRIEKMDPDNIPSSLATKDFFIDSQYQILASLDQIQPKDASTIELPHEVQFSDYRLVSGLLVPFSITDIIFGQHTSTIQLSQIVFKSGLTDSDFAL